jgi:hypothetical protein
MSNTQHNHPHGDINPHPHQPYWTRAHRDWRVWVGVILMMIAILYYVMSDELMFQPKSLTQPVPTAVAK